MAYKANRLKYPRGNFKNETTDIFDDYSEAGVTYVGYARPGTVLTSEQSWAIIKIDETQGTVVKYPDGYFAYTNSWDSRTTLNYEFRKF